MTKQKASANEPFLPFFVGDFIAATSEWEGEAISLYATLLLHQWAIGTIPADPKRICKLVRWDWDLFQAHWRTVRRKFQATQREDEDGELEDRLLNPRLEQHRAKTKELKEKNSASGSKGAAAKWGDRDESDQRMTRAQRLAEARKRGSHQQIEWVALITICGEKCVKCSVKNLLVKHHIVPIYQGGSDGIDNLQPLCKPCSCAKGADQKDFRPNDWRERLANLLKTSGGASNQNGAAHIYASGGARRFDVFSPDISLEKTSGENVKTSGNPSHPIPSHTTEIDISPQILSAHSVVGENTHTENVTGDKPRPPEELADHEHHERFERVKAAYPEFSGRPSWIMTEAACRRLVQRGEATWDELEEGVKRFAAFVKAGGRSGPQYVDTPLNFFTAEDRPWTAAWTPPPSKDEQRIADNIDETQAWLAERRASKNAR